MKKFSDFKNQLLLTISLIFMASLINAQVCDETGALAISDQTSEFCCFELQLTNSNAQVFTDIKITPISNLKFENVIIDPNWGYSTSTDTEIQINPSAFVPTGTFTPISLCIKDFDTAPQKIQLEWIGLGGESCLDTITLECKKCMNISYDTLTCDPLGFRFDFDFINISDFNMEQLEVVSVTPNATIVAPNVLYIPTIVPGQSSIGHTFYFNPPAGTSVLSFQIKAESNDGCCVCISDFIHLEVPNCNSPCDTTENCVEIIETTMKEINCEKDYCYATPFCQEWLRDLMTNSTDNGCQPIFDFYRFDRAIWNGQTVFVGYKLGAPDGGSEHIYDCEGNLLQSCEHTITTQCNPDAGIDIGVDLTAMNTIWNCGNPLPSLDLCDVHNVNDIYTCVEYCSTVLNNSNPAKTVDQIRLGNIISGVTISPSVFIFSPGIAQGGSRTITYTVCGDFYPGDFIPIHIGLFNSEDEWCCTAIEPLEVEIPECPVCDNPCELKSYTVNEEQGDEYCCSSIDITTECDSTFKCIELEVLNGAYFGTASAGSQWSIMNLSPTIKRWCPRSIFTGSDYIPAGTITGKINYCLKGFTSIPQQVVMRWIGNNGEVICTDTIISECEPPPSGDCIIILNDTVKCEPEGGFAYCFSVKNVGMFTGDYVRLDRLHSKPAGGIFAPPVIDKKVNLPIGTTVVMPPINITNVNSGDTVCFVLSVYDTIPGMTPGGPTYNSCCHTDTLCIVMPICDTLVCDGEPCEKNSYSLNSTGIGDDCCYEIELYGECDSIFAAIELEVLNGGSFRSASTPSDWQIMNLSTNKKVWKPRSVYTGSDYIPSGNVSGKINFCLAASNNITQKIVIRWLGINGEVICTDTMTAICEILPGDCIVVINDTVTCDTSGHYSYCFDVKNVGNFTGEYIKIHHLHSNPSGGVFSPSSIDTAVHFPIGDSVTMPCIQLDGMAAGDKFCFVVSVYDSISMDGYNNCCHSDTICIELPPCGNSDVCSQVEISSQPAVDTIRECCHTLSIHNNYLPNYFTSLRVFGLNPGIILGFVANTADWNMTPITGGYEFTYIPATYVPMGTSVIGDFCLGNFNSNTQTLEVQWLAEPNGYPEVVCCSALETRCEVSPDYPCMQVEEQEVYCDQNTNLGVFNFSLINNTDQGNTTPGFVVNMITVDVVSAPASATISPLSFDYSSTPIPIGGSGNLDQINITGVNAGDQICLRVTGHNVQQELKECCTSDETICFTMPCDVLASNNSSIELDRYQVYPTPVVDVLFIEAISGVSDIKISLFDINGRLIYEGSRSSNINNTVDVSKLTTGIYMLRITTDQGQEVHKILKSE